MKATYERQLALYQKSHATVFENHRKKVSFKLAVNQCYQTG